MITYFDKPILQEYLAYTIFYGLEHKYTFSYVQKQLSNSRFVKSLENDNECLFLYNVDNKAAIKEIYELEEEPDDVLHLDSLSLWISEGYLELFYKYHKSFSYIFLYLPINKMIDLFPLYHEMDWTQLFKAFEEEINKRSLLNKILDQKKISINVLSQLTGISRNTLITYTNDDRLKEAKFDYVYRIINALNLDINLFVNKLSNQIQSQIITNDMNNELFSLIALAVIGCNSDQIAKRNYKYNKHLGYMEDDDGHKMILFSTSNNRIEGTRFNKEVIDIVNKCKASIDESNRDKYVIVIMENNMNSNDVKEYQYLAEYGFERIYIINSEYLLVIKKSSVKHSVNLTYVEKIKNRIL